MSESLSYAGSGVDREVAARAKERIAELVRSTSVPGVLSETGSFGGLFALPAGHDSPVLVASADGVGTKLKVAIRAGRHDTVGHDLVNHCVNDILVEGARPLFFLDYVGMGKLDAGVVEALVAGVAAGCRENGCALLGGETAEMPDFYAPGDYDLAGFVVGVVEKDGRPGPHRVRAGDRLVGIASGGFHTNGYSLLRHLLFDRLGLEPSDPFPGDDSSVADVLLRVHRSYLASVSPLIRDGSVHALAHITGGGIPDNLERVLPEGVTAKVERASWSVPEECRQVAELGGVEEEEMYRTFNMGVGLILIVPPESLDPVLGRLSTAGETAWPMGELVGGEGGVALV